MGSMSAAPIDRKVRGALSPSRAGDFMSCPLLFRYRTIDRLPESSSPDAVRGTLVHQVLEDIFDLPAAERTPRRRTACSSRPGRSCASGPARPARWPPPSTSRPGSSRRTRCSTAGSPWRTRPGWSPPSARPTSRRRSTPGCRCAASSTGSTSAPDGALRVVDYKTGQLAAEGFEAQALFQLRIYALILWRSRGVVPRMLQLVYLGDGEIVRYEPDEADLLATERKVDAIWEAIEVARAHRRVPAQPGQAVRLVRLQGALPGLRRRAAADAGAAVAVGPAQAEVRRRWRRVRRRLRGRR